MEPHAGPADRPLNPLWAGFGTHLGNGSEEPEGTTGCHRRPARDSFLVCRETAVSCPGVQKRKRQHGRLGPFPGLHARSARAGSAVAFRENRALPGWLCPCRARPGTSRSFSARPRRCRPDGISWSARPGVISFVECWKGKITVPMGAPRNSSSIRNPVEAARMAAGSLAPSRTNGRTAHYCVRCRQTLKGFPCTGSTVRYRSVFTAALVPNDYDRQASWLLPHWPLRRRCRKVQVSARQNRSIRSQASESNSSEVA